MGNSITFLGTGTSQGIPMIGCGCGVCTSTDIKDKRLRSSAYIEYEGQKILIDAGPDFRQQMLTHHINHIDAILLTHQHKDHTGGLDDVRAYNYIESKSMPIYAESRVEESLKMEYSYAFMEKKYPGVPEYELRTIDNSPFTINGVNIIPIRVMHHKLPILGFRIGTLGYITDANRIDDSELEKLKGVKVFVVNTIRRATHISHFSLDEALEVCRRVGAQQSYLTHISHQLERHEELKEYLRNECSFHVEPAYDGLTIPL